MIPGEVIVAAGTHELAPSRERRELRVLNTGDRPIQVGSHFHFADANAALEFDRAAAAGFRLDAPPGTPGGVGPGFEQTVRIVALAGAARVPGLQVRR